MADDPALVRATLPGRTRQLPGPSAEDDIRGLEEAVGQPLPADQVAWWRHSDGTGDNFVSLIPGTWTPASTGYALRQYRLMLTYIPQEPELSQWSADPAGSGADDWLPQCLPIGHNYGGSSLFLDLRTGARSGCVCSQYKEDIGFDAPIWPSVTTMLAEVAHALVTGTEIRGKHAVIEDGRLNWAFVSSDGGGAGAGI
ncbi:SMI1/KNR4 family protein [Winogradskya humida]|nr:SMI1/KNR4 family protein [Actinoplanes humidus]